MKKRLIKASEDWYIEIPEGAYSSISGLYNVNDENGVKDIVKENINDICKIFNVSKQEALSNEFITKLYNATLIDSCIDYYSDYHKDIHGVRFHFPSFDMSSKDAFLEDFHKKINDLENFEEDNEKYWQEQEEYIKETIKEIMDYDVYNYNVDDLKKFKKEYETYLSEDEIKQVNDLIKELEQDEYFDNLKVKHAKKLIS